ncbi:MAG TPA: permease [Candidatus Gracilibacteria bacterium]
MEEVVTQVVVQNGTFYAILGAAISAFVAGMGSILGILTPGSKGAGVLAEKPDLFGKILVLAALPGSQGVYGLLIAIMILQASGVLGGGEAVSLSGGYQLLVAGILMGLAGLASAYFQGKVVSAGISAVAKDDSLSGKMIVLSVLIETYAIFGLLVALFIVLGV